LPAPTGTSGAPEWQGPRPGGAPAHRPTDSFEGSGVTFGALFPAPCPDEADGIVRSIAAALDPRDGPPAEAIARPGWACETAPGQETGSSGTTLWRGILWTEPGGACPVVVAVLNVGYVVGGDSAAPARGHGRPVLAAKLTPAQLILTASTATGIHLRYTGITTGPALPTHDNDIPIDSFQFGVGRSVSSPAAGGVRTAGTPSVSEITLTHTTDAFSVALLKAALKGAAPGATANLYLTDMSGPGSTLVDYEIDLGQTLLSSFSMSSGGGNPSESFSLNFVTMTFKYRVPGTTTIQTVSYNIATGI
jgi:type VI secretion system secreted protein Hcp